MSEFAQLYSEEDGCFDNNLNKGETYGKMKVCGNHISTLYNTVEEYRLYQYFQRLGESLSLETGLELGDEGGNIDD